MYPMETSNVNSSTSTSSPSSDSENKKRSKMNKSSYKHVPHREKPPHLVAKRNERERRRVQQVNSAFCQLRKTVPVENRNKRLSKVKTLQRAIEYIESLTGLLSSLGAEMPPLSSLHHRHHHADDEEDDGDDDDDLVESPDASSSQSQSPFMLIGDADRSISPLGSPTVITSHSNETTRYLHSPSDRQVYQLPFQSNNSVSESCNGRALESTSLLNNNLNNNLCGKVKESKKLSLIHNGNSMDHTSSCTLDDNRLNMFKSEQLYDEATHSYAFINGHNSFDMSQFNQMNQSPCFTLHTSDINSDINNSCCHNEVAQQIASQTQPHHPHHLHNHDHGASGLHHHPHTHDNTSCCGNPSANANANNRSSDFTSIYSQLQ